METSRGVRDDAEEASWDTPWPGASVVLKARTVSTMDDALELARAGCPTGTVAAADYQEKGRGRVPGRTWLSSPKESLLATLVLRIPEMGFPLAQLPLRAGVAVARGIEDAVASRASAATTRASAATTRASAAGIEVQIKWPNDLVAGGRKLAGLLCEAHGDAALVGIGVNCSQAAFPHEIAGTACSLLQLCGRSVPPPVLLRAILARLKAAAETAGWREEMRRRLHKRGQVVRVELLGSARIVEGEMLDIDDQGRLILRISGGRLETLSQGELIPAP